jgi:hypothetical protein
MGDKGDALKLLIIRTLIASPFIVLGFFMVSKLRGAGAFLLILPVFLIGGPLALLVTDPVKGVYFSWKKRRGKPVLLFSVAESLIMEERFSDALERYREMLAVEPQSLEVYGRIIELSLDHMKRPDLARKYLHRGMHKLKRQEDRDRLAGIYRRNMILFRENNRNMLYTSDDQGASTNPFA